MMSTVVVVHDSHRESRPGIYPEDRARSPLKREAIEKVDDNIVRFDRLRSYTCYSHIYIHGFRWPVMT